MSEWSTSPLHEVLEFREGPGIMASEFRDSGTPLIRLAGLKSGASLLARCNYIDDELVARRYPHFRLERGDVLLSTSASLGEVATVKDEGAGAIAYTGIIAFRPKGELIDARFIEWILRSPGLKDQIESMGVGSVMKHFGPSHLRSMHVTYPDKPSQRAIAEVLGALDDKITANRNAVGQFDQLVAFLFKRASEAGPHITLSSLASFVNGGAYTKGASGSGRVVVRIAELNGGIGGSTVFSDAKVPDDQTARFGDLLFAWSGSLTIHRWYRDDAIINQHIFKVLPKDENPRWLVHQALLAALPSLKAIAADKATTMGHIKREHLDTLVQVPDPQATTYIGPLLQGAWDLALATEQESLRLIALRDALLPALMSGKLRVKDAERAVEDVL
ncbi:hypothetical protein C5D07_04015 [Rathayibacter tritici]|uniref:restriction endonuclease subunit S n=1 Tax=Rathayibacter tritici TaxID=33888 RepID=UPI000CE729CE|nr:restriction endonuclease subunit S [Rathayibacter tritici]PPF28569.1 hypothetical protein C5C06_07625 [Rathayibacter tritici]PPI18027.1 hypothetical protein C5D07_04015 [Rathayibacter tritici]